MSRRVSDTVVVLAVSEYLWSAGVPGADRWGGSLGCGVVFLLNSWVSVGARSVW